MENNIKIQIVFAVILTIALIGFLYMTMNLNKDGLACSKNPLNYGVSKMQTHFNNPIYCSCIADNTLITFNDTMLKAEYI